MASADSSLLLAAASDQALVIAPTVGATSATSASDIAPTVGTPAADLEPAERRTASVILDPDVPPFKKLRTTAYVNGPNVYSLGRVTFYNPDGSVSTFPVTRGAVMLEEWLPIMGLRPSTSSSGTPSEPASTPATTGPR
jgi:hypothetical protein